MPRKPESKLPGLSIREENAIALKALQSVVVRLQRLTTGNLVHDRNGIQGTVESVATMLERRVRREEAREKGRKP